MTIEQKQINEKGGTGLSVGTLNYNNKDIQAITAIATKVAEQVVERNLLIIAGDIATDIRDKRVVKITQNLIKNLVNKYSKEELNKIKKEFQKPVIQYTYGQACQGYAIQGNNNINSLDEQLVDLLSNRINNDNQTLKNLILEEAIKKIPQLNQEQLDLLTIIFLFYYSINNVRNFISFKVYLNGTLKPFLSNVTNNELTLSHLQYLGCLNKLSISKIPPLEIFRTRYSAFFMKGFKIEEVSEELKNIPNLFIKC